MSNEQIVFCIPVRAGSRRIPNKNMLVLDGETLIARKIRQLLPLGTVVVGSDSDEMLREAERAGAVTVRRKCTDEGHDSSNDMWKEFMELIEPMNPDTVVWTHVTSPMTRTETYKKALEEYRLALRDGYDSLISVAEVKEHFWCTDMRTPMYNVTWCKNMRHLCANELSPLYKQTGAIFIQSYKQAKQCPYFFGDRPKLFVTNFMESFDLNTPEDLVCLQALYKYYGNPK